MHNEIAAYKRRISKITTELKVETAERNAFQARMEKMQKEIDALQDENKSWKQLYFDIKRKVSSGNGSTSAESSSATRSRNGVLSSNGPKNITTMTETLSITQLTDESSSCPNLIKLPNLDNRDSSDRKTKT